MATDQNTYICGGQRRKLNLFSGTFTTLLKSSLLVIGWQAGPSGITGDETDSADSDWFTADDIVWYSGQFSSTVLSSYVSPKFPNFRSLSATPDDITVCDVSYTELFTYSGHTTGTFKDSIVVTTWGVTPYGVSHDEANTSFNTHTTQKMFLLSGHFTTTLKSSLPYPFAITNLQDVSFNGTNEILITEDTDKMYEMSGQFSTTSKTSLSVAVKDLSPRGIDTQDMVARLTATSQPEIEVSPLTVDFEDTFITTTEEKIVTIHNLGTAFLTVTSVATTSAFYTVAGLSTHPGGATKAFSIPPLGSTLAYVLFTPVDYAIETGHLYINSDDLSEPITSVFLTGYGSNLPPMEGTQNFTLYIDQQRTQDRYITQGRSFTGYVDQARNFDLEL